MEDNQVKKISDSVYEFCKPDNPSVEIIFFHGIQMGEEDVSELHLSTWTVKSEEADAPPEYWPQTFFAKDEHLTSKNISVRALTARYDPSKYKTHNTGRLDLYNIAENFTHSIIDNNRVNVGLREGVPVIMVGHSFGGLVMKKLVDQVAEKARLNGNHSKNLQKFLDNLKGLFYYSTPHLALKDDVFQRLFPPGKSYSDLPKLLEELNKGAGRLHAVLTTYAKGHKIMVNEAFDVNNTDLGDNLEPIQIVTEASAGCGAESKLAISEDHFNVCRPRDVKSSNYQALANFIVKIVEREKAKKNSDAAGLDLPEVGRRR